MSSKESVDGTCWRNKKWRSRLKLSNETWLVPIYVHPRRFGTVGTYSHPGASVIGSNDINQIGLAVEKKGFLGYFTWDFYDDSRDGMATSWKQGIGVETKNENQRMKNRKKQNRV